VLHVRQHVGEDAVERRVGVARAVGRRPRQALAQLAGVARADRRELGQPLPVLDERVDDAVPEPPQLFGVERQRRPGLAQLEPSNSSASEFMQ
jgi:hypothetical protein